MAVARLCRTDIEFRWLIGDAGVQKSTLSDFRTRHFEELCGLSLSGLTPSEGNVTGKRGQWSWKGPSGGWSSCCTGDAVAPGARWARKLRPYGDRSPTTRQGRAFDGLMLLIGYWKPLVLKGAPSG